jgi:hypothetical protein
MKPCLCLNVPLPEIKRDNRCSDQHNHDKRDPVTLKAFRYDKEDKDGYGDKKDDDIQFYRETVKFPPELIFGFLIHLFNVTSGIKVLDVSPHIV